MKKNAIRPADGSRTNWRFPRRKERREQAAVRQAEYDALSTEQKIARAEGRRGNSKKELTRLRRELCPT